MFKGFMKTLFVVGITFVGLGSAFANAPVLNDLPDVTVSDFEDNTGTDNNYFVFTDAFVFDEFVSDDITPKADLKWSFDEVSGDDGVAQYYQINGKDPLHAGDAAIGTAHASGDGTHNPPPTANELRQGFTTASFRDIVFSPTSDLTAPWVGPAGSADQTAHANGKLVRFFVSDGFNVVSNDVLVNTIDDLPRDGISRASSWTPGLPTDTFDTGSETWINNNVLAVSTAAAGGSLQITYQATTSGAPFKIGSWATRNVSGDGTNSLPYATVGTDKYVRGKFSIYSSQATGDLNPSFRMRVSQRDAIQGVVFIDPNGATYAPDIRPSAEAARPSLYRVDFDPIDAPAASTGDTATGNGGAGIEIDREWVVISNGTAEAGTLYMTEAAIGTYPKLVDNTPVKQYLASANDFIGGAAAGAVAIDSYGRGSGGVYLAPTGTTIYANTGYGVTVTANTSGLTVDARSASQTAIVVVASDITNGNNADQTNTAGRIRIGEDQLYKVKFHATASPVEAKNNVQMRFQVRSLGFQYTNYLELGPGAVGGTNRELASQVMPGTGNLIPSADKDGTEAGGYYTVLFHSPMSKQIRPETSFAGAALSVRMPNISALAPEGTATTTSDQKRRDIIPGVVLITGYCPDGGSSSFPGVATQAGYVNIDKIQFYRYPALLDGSQGYGL